MNREKMRNQLFGLGIATPLVLLASAWTTALWLAGIFLILIATLQALDLLLPAAIRTSPRQIILLIAAAAESTGLDVLLQAYAWSQHAALHAYLPIVAIAGFVFFSLQKPAEPNLLVLARTTIVAACGILLTGVFMQALNSTGRIVFVPCALLLLIGCLCALTQHLAKKPGSAKNSKIRRVRVTGPVS